MAATHHPATALSGLFGSRTPARARPARNDGGATGWWRDLFAPGRGLRARAVDVLVAAAIGFLQVAGTISYGQDEPSPWAFDALAGVILTIGPVALLLRRRWPEATLVVALVAAAGYAATGYPRGPAGFPAFAFALVTVIMMGRRTFAWSVLVVSYAAFMALPQVNPDEVEKARSLPEAAVNLAWWLPLTGLSSEIVRVRLERRDERARAARDEARRRASEERLLIARELHDVLAHNISLINVQSGVALHLLDERPEHARPALEAINEASEEALGELRSVLDVLSRGVDEGGLPSGSDGWAPRSPTAGLGDLDDLVRRTRAAGLDVQLVVEGEAGPAPIGVDLAALRIVQEALTNVVRHAGGDARATIRLTHTPTELTVQVDDDGSADSGEPMTAGNGAGRGIAGMRERTHALGGTFAAGPRPCRGFRVRARFPLGDEAR